MARNIKRNTLTTNRATDEVFAIPEDKRYPINNKDQAREALRLVSRFGNDGERAQVRKAIDSRYAGLADGPVTNKSTSKLVANTRQRVRCVFNTKSPAVRYEVLEGRRHVVVPMVMITDGVHAGSNGPLYYPPNELSKTPEVWDHKPVVVDHPTVNGQAVSACSPREISRRKIGIVMNTRYIPGQPGKLRAEAWIALDRADAVDPRVMKCVRNGKMMEVSTGLFTDNVDKTGSFRGKEYTTIAKNYRPDHLAILPDDKGACSRADGAGLLRNSAGRNNTAQHKEQAMTRKQKRRLVSNLISNGAFDEDDRDTLMKFRGSKLAALVDNGDEAGGGTITDGHNDDGGDELREGTVGAKATPKKKKHVDDEDDADVDHEIPKKTAADKAADDKNAKPTGNSRRLTFNNLLATAPADVREMFAVGLERGRAEKRAIISKITSNARNQYSKDELKAKSYGDLCKIAALMGPVTNSEDDEDAGNGANFAGFGQEVLGDDDEGEDADGMTANTSGSFAQQALVSPQMTFNRRKDTVEIEDED